MAKKNSLGKDYREVYQAIKKEMIHSLYFFVVEEHYLSDLLLKALKNALITEGMEELDLYQHNFLGEPSITEEQLLQWLSTPPFLSKKRLVILKNTGIGQAGSAYLQKIQEILMRIPDFVCVVFIEEKLDRKQKNFIKFLEKEAVLVDLPLQSVKELYLHIQKILKQKNLTFSDKQIYALIERTENQMYLLHQELSKLFAYLEAQNLTLLNDEVFERLVLPNLNVDIFKFIDAIFEKNFTKAHQFLQTLRIKEKDAMILWVFLLAKHLKQLIYAQQIPNPSDLNQVLKVHPFIAEKLSKQASTFKLNTLFKLYESCYQMDYALKTGQVSSEYVMEILIAQWKKEMLSFKFNL